MRVIDKIPVLSLIIFFKLVCFANAQETILDRIKFIDSYYENASPIIWDALGDTAIKITILYDYERDNINRQATHINIKIEAEPGTELNLVLSGFENIYNGVRRTSFGRNLAHNYTCFFSEDYNNWIGVEATPVTYNDFDFQVKYKMRSGTVYVARLPVYSLTRQEEFNSRIFPNKFIKIITIGHTVEQRPLEIIRVGYPNAKHNILIRARSHPWEPGGNWVIEGIVDGFIEESEKSDKWSEKFCYYIMPMANKDGVFRGMSRFNVRGIDLNRGWGVEADSLLAPENYYLEQFIKKLIKQGNKPDFMIDFHNDMHGNIHISRPLDSELDYSRSLSRFFKFMQDKTWYSGRTSLVYTADPLRHSIGAGLYERYNIHGCIFELNANWIPSLDKIPSSSDWQQLGRDMNEVFYFYFQ